MSNIICVTNRKLCKVDFLQRIDEIAKANIDGIVLREKDLSEEKYYELAKCVIDVCNKHNTRLILHYYPNVAKKLGIKNIHLPVDVLKSLSSQDRACFEVLGASCHCVEDAKIAQNLGCTYVFAGHIFETDCKKGLEGRGLEFLKRVCDSVSIPVYAIGGISGDNYNKIIYNGAVGGAVMSGLMACDNVKEYLDCFEGKNDI